MLKNRRQPQLWQMMVTAVLFLTIATGFTRESSADSEAVYKGLKTFADVIEMIEKNYVDPVDTEKLVQEAIQGMVSSLDPHSLLLPPEEFEDLQIDTKGKFTGIGISISIRDGFVTVVSPIEGTPAYRAGIKAGDKIIKVDGKPVKDLREAVKKMRGPKGTKVAVTVARKGEPEPIVFNLIRDVIPIQSVRATTLKPGYGYVWVTHFRDKTVKDLKAALKKIEKENGSLKGLVLDLRDNPGGLLPQAIKMSDLFLTAGDILSIKGRLKRHTRAFSAHDNKDDVKCPVVVLINGGSASASEIVAGALQDNKRAVILGTASFGKGSVQTVETLRDGYGLKLTIARYYTPSGRSIQAKGIEPDITVYHSVLDPQELADGEKRLLKEKDLQNHLDAEPGKPGDDTKTKSKKQGKKRRPSHGPLDPERLETDNQVVRALDILMGYDILKSALAQ
ncbi:MAG: S41 family peptidase [Desulfobacterales bacterium]|nr:S41 family peptidase [Desulfobacterales bacterium]